MNDDSIVKIMQALDLDYSKAILSTMQFTQSIEGLNKQLANSKNIAMQTAKDINTAFSSQLGGMGSKQILDQFGKPFKTIRDEAKATSTNVRDMAKSYKESYIEQMKAQVASIQQRTTTKGLSQEYTKQAGALREQLNVIQARLQAEGKLSAEEIKQTQQLKEQLDILKAQTRTAISDDIRTNPSTFGQEWERRSSWFLTGAMFYGTINAAKEATQSIKDVEMGMVEIARVMTDSSFVFNDYRDNLFKLGIDYGQTFDNVQQIALRWAQSGYNVADSLKLTETSLLALNTAELDATQATEAMIGIMAQWQLQAEDMALVMDKINITADRHSVTSQDLVDGLLRSSGAARIMNLSLEETLGLLTVMREASGRTGQEVGNALNSILSYIQRPGSIKTLESLGISMFADSAKTQFRNVLDIFKDIASNWNTLSTEIQDGFVKSADDAELFNEELANALGMQEEWNDLQQRDISQAAAGVYRRNYFIGMIERLANVQGVLNNMMDAEGYSMRENAQTMEALDKKQQSLKVSMEALAVAAGDAGLGGSLKSLASGGTTALNTINKMPKEMKDLVMATTSTFIAVKTLELGMKTFGIELPGISQMIASLTSGTWSLTAALKAGGAGLATFAKANAPLLALSAAVGAIVAVRNAIKKQREEQEKAIEVAKENIQSYEEQKQGLQELAREYDTLKDKEKNLTATTDEKQRLIEIQRELVELYGVSITGIDAEGQAYADSTNAIRDRIKALEEMKSIEEKNLETAVMARDVQDVADLEKNLDKRLQLEKDILEKQKEIDEYTNTLLNKGSIATSSQYGSSTIDASTEHGAKILRDYIGNLSREKSSLQTALGDVNTAISEGTEDRQQLLKEDAVKIVQQLDKNGVVISDSARAYATELAKALSQAPRDIFTLKDELEQSIKDFTSSAFDEWTEKYKKAISENDTSGIDEASNAIMRLVRKFIDGKPELDNFALAMEGAFANSKALKDATKSTIDLKTSLTSMGSTAKKAMDELKTLNQAIHDVKRGQSLSIDTIFELIEKYNLSTDAIKQTAKGYTVEISALENLRDVKRKTAIEKIEAERQDAEAVRQLTQSRLLNYGLEIEQLQNLAEAKKAIAQLADAEARKAARSVVGTPTNVREDALYFQQYSNIYDEYMDKAGTDINALEKAIKDIEELDKRAKLLTSMINDSSYGVSTSKAKKEPKYENKALEEALKLLEHRKRISEETQDSIKAEIAELNRINSLYVKTADERMNLAERIYAAEKRLKDRRLQDSINWINERKNFDELSIEREIYLWEKVKRTQSNNIEAIEQAELNLYKLKNQLRTENLNKEESTIKHLTKLGVYSVQQQIDAYKNLYSIKANSLDEERNRVENLFSLYKSLLAEQQRKIKDAYDDRIRQIESEANAKKAMQDDVIRGIEAELKLLDRQEQAYDHDKKMADLKEQLAYWQVRTSEDARKKVAELLKQIDEAEHDREIELKKQGLEDKKQIAQDEVKAIDEAAKRERENWEKSYKLVERAFDDHSTNIVALAATMSQEAYQQWESNYLIPLQNALSSGNFSTFDSLSWGLEDSLNDFSSYWDNFDSNWGTAPTTHDWGMSDADYKKFKENGWRWAELQAQGFKQATNAEMQRLNAENDALRIKYGRDPGLGEKPQFHTGAKTLSYGVAEFMPGELVFPPDLSIKLEGLIAALYQRPISQSTSSSFADNRKEIKFNNLLNIERNYMEDEIDGDILSRQLQRQLTSLF